MAATPMSKLIFLALDGDDFIFDIELNNRVTQSAALRLVEYSLQDATAAWLDLQFVNMRGFQLNPIASNTAAPDSFILHTPLSDFGPVVYTPGRLLGTMSGGEMRSFSISIKGPDGAPHNPDTNKLFGTLLITLLVDETPVPRMPPALITTVPSIQQTIESS